MSSSEIAEVQLLPQNYCNTSTVHLLLFCIMTNKYTIIMIIFIIIIYYNYDIIIIVHLLVQKKKCYHRSRRFDTILYYLSELRILGWLVDAKYTVELYCCSLWNTTANIWYGGTQWRGEKKEKTNSDNWQDHFSQGIQVGQLATLWPINPLVAGMLCGRGRAVTVLCYTHRPRWCSWMKIITMVMQCKLHYRYCCMKYVAFAAFWDSCTCSSDIYNVKVNDHEESNLKFVSV
jgi:hypothetical protein